MKQKENFKWISFVDSKPKEYQEILVSDGRSVWIDELIYDNEDWYLEEYGTYLGGLVWMPAPEPPELYEIGGKND
jgi:hypothetical protein